MALRSDESYLLGFVHRRSTRALSVTATTSGATYRDGFLRDADGRLVVKGG